MPCPVAPVVPDGAGIEFVPAAVMLVVLDWDDDGEAADPEVVAVEVVAGERDDDVAGELGAMADDVEPDVPAVAGSTIG